MTRILEGDGRYDPCSWHRPPGVSRSRLQRRPGLRCAGCTPVDILGKGHARNDAPEGESDAQEDPLKGHRTPPLRFKLRSGADLRSAPPMRWMVRGVLPMEGLAALYGPSGSGKSFLTLDLAAAVAGGTGEWFARRATQCPVTYVCLEGSLGIGNRLNAWCQYHGKPVPDSLRFVTEPFDLRKPGHVSELADAIKAVDGTGGLVILDTLNRAAPGVDENSSVDMGKVIAAATHLQALTGGLVLLVHHTGKDANKGLRGHSSLHAALDGAIAVLETNNRRQWSVAKSKDEEAGNVFEFKLLTLTVGVDDDGEAITSCVVLPDDTGSAVKRAKVPQGENQRLVMAALHPLFAAGVTGVPGVPATRPCIEMEAALAAGARNLTCATDKRTSRAREAITGLIKRGVLGCHDGWVWLA